VNGDTIAPHVPVRREYRVRGRMLWHPGMVLGSRRLAELLTSSEEERCKPVAPPEPAETVTFEKHIKPLFRAKDQQSMQAHLDLWPYHDVSKHASAILGRLRSGTMPCDGAWTADRLDAFDRWVQGGCLE
jgi:hypothetical protein